MIIDCISDLHGYLPKLEGGDLLIVAGDLTARDESEQYEYFFEWLSEQNYRKKIFISGNHDNLHMSQFDWFDAEYLCDSGTEFEGLKIFGTPWTKTFPGMNPHCKAFTCDTEDQLHDKFKLIPHDTNILISHSPPYGVLDGIPMEDGSLFHVGSTSLSKAIATHWDSGLIFHVFGHIHEAYGERKEQNPIFSTHQINASYVNERYKPVNKPVRIVL